MEVIADLHLHSKYSRAVSKKMEIKEIARWGVKKGIDLLATADWTHPLWLRELKANLKQTSQGIYQIKNGEFDKVSFVLSTEISSIYTQGGKGRRIHNLVFAPNFETVEKINQALRSQGANLMSDGRPIIGLSAKELTKLVLGINKQCLVIPAHIWTPWYSLYGSKSGFDSFKECFGEFSDQIYAIETGLSSDPAMNWQIKELDSRTILSFSDAHSPSKLGREATVFRIPKDRRLSYEMVRRAVARGEDEKWEMGQDVGMRNEKRKNLTPASRFSTHVSPLIPHISYTIEFYPEEGKYHWTGHRKCKVKHSPAQTKKLGVTCPVCGKKLTVGVMHRVEQLASRESKKETKKGETGICWFCQKNRPPYVKLVPLMEILSEVLSVGVKTKTVKNEYKKLTGVLGSEFFVLLKAGFDEIARICGEKVAKAVIRSRSGQVVVDPGYDGVFGEVKIWGEEEQKDGEEQMSLF